MCKNLLLIALLLSTTNTFAEISSCNVGGSAVFTKIDLNAETRKAAITDQFEHKVDGRITLIREHGKGASEFNVSFEYKMNNTPTHIDLIIVPVNEDTYKVGVAGYIKKNGKNYLDIADNDEAMCF